MYFTHLLAPALIVLATLATSSTSLAQSISVQNFSFESPAVPANTGFSPNMISNWTGGGGIGIAVGDFGVQSLAVTQPYFPSGLPDGVQFAYVNAGYIFQDSATVLTAGTTYTLTAYLGRRPDDPGAAGSISLKSFVGGLPTAVLATTGSVTSPINTFTKFTTTFTASNAQDGQELGIVLTNTGSGQVDFDAVSLTQTPPAVLSSLTFLTPVAGGTVLNGTVTLSGITASDVVVGLSSSDSSVVRPHRAVIVPAGSSSATFEIDTYRSHITKTVTLQATLAAVVLTKDLTITGR